jgi:hypothetical protein
MVPTGTRPGQTVNPFTGRTIRRSDQFWHIQLIEATMNAPASKSVLHRLENEHLSAVTFVHDYLQLHFNGPCLTAYVWPHIVTQKGTIAQGGAGYRDALCGLIGSMVERAFEELGARLVIQFAEGRTLEIPIKETNKEGPEAAMFQDASGKSWNVW